MRAAIAYAERGWPVHPLRPTDGTPLLRRDKGPGGVEIPNSGGVRKASADPAKVRRWWSRWPDALIAAAAGEPIGAFVLDVDVKGLDGREALAALEDEHGKLSETWEAATPSGGLHLYFRQPQRTLRNRVGFAPGLDVRSTGASITLPPSVKPTGGYRWVRRPSSHPLAEAPEWLLRLIAPPERPRGPYRPLRLDHGDRYAAAALASECRALASMGENSGRNQRLFQASARLGELIASGLLDSGTVEAQLEEAADACGLTTDTGGLGGVRATIASGLGRGVKNPRPRPSSLTPEMRAHMARRSEA